MKDEIIKLRKLGFSYNEISKKTGYSKSTISYHCSKIDINNEQIEKNIDIKNKKQIKNLSPFLKDNETIENIILLRKEKKTYSEIKKELGITIHVISKVCREYVLFKNRKFKNIKEEDIDNIIKEYLRTKNIREVSKILQIDRGTISKYLKLNNITAEINKGKKLSDSERVIEWRRRVKIELVEYKGGECEECGYKKCIDALEFHHKDPNEKDFTISGKSWSFERLKKEADKCILVCSNCHKEIHFNLKTTHTSPS